MTKQTNKKPLKLHPDYEFVDQDEVFVENSNGTTDYFQLIYEPEMGAWMLIPFTSKHFDEPKKDEEGKTNAEFFYEYGFEVLERVEDYHIDELP